MTPSQNKSTTESLALYEQTLKGNNAAALSIKAYMGDLNQFVSWLHTFYKELYSVIKIHFLPILVGMST
jgi:hypothetical protein